MQFLRSVILLVGAATLVSCDLGSAVSRESSSRDVRTISEIHPTTLKPVPTFAALERGVERRASKKAASSKPAVSSGRPTVSTKASVASATSTGYTKQYVSWAEAQEQTAAKSCSAPKTKRGILLRSSPGGSSIGGDSGDDGDDSSVSERSFRVQMTQTKFSENNHKLVAEGLFTCIGITAIGTYTENGSTKTGYVVSHLKPDDVPTYYAQFKQQVQASHVTVTKIRLSMPDPKTCHDPTATAAENDGNEANAKKENENVEAWLKRDFPGKLATADIVNRVKGAFNEFGYDDDGNEVDRDC